MTSLAHIKVLSMLEIAERVAAYYHVRVKDLTGPRRYRSFVIPRQVAMYLVRKHAAYSMEQIGEFFGRDHSTVVHAVQTVANDRKHDAEFDARVRYLSDECAEISTGIQNR